MCRVHNHPVDSAIWWVHASHYRKKKAKHMVEVMVLEYFQCLARWGQWGVVDVYIQ